MGANIVAGKGQTTNRRMHAFIMTRGEAMLQVSGYESQNFQHGIVSQITYLQF